MPKESSTPPLKRGDLLMSLCHGSTDTTSHRAISGFQKAVTAYTSTVALFNGRIQPLKDSRFVHAAIVTKDCAIAEAATESCVAEAIGKGISINPLDAGHHFVVFRYNLKNGLAECVGQTASAWAMPGTEKYAFGRLVSAPLSMPGLGYFGKRHVAKMSEMIGGPLKTGTKMICSEFAIICWNATSYAAVREYAINADAKSCTPMELVDRLRKSPNWTEYGEFST